MCLILLAWQADPNLPLVLAANRDEYHARPTQAARFWADQPQLLAGRDLRAGGTWMGITRSGRLAAVTNYREPGLTTGERSRGDLCRGFLGSDLSPGEYLRQLAPAARRYGGFNLLLGDGRQLWFYSNQEGVARVLTAGIYGVSNGRINAGWPKVTQGRRRLGRLLARGFGAEPALQLLARRRPPPDRLLPDTGVGLELERLLGPTFICSPDYGTRTSTVLTVDRDGEARWVERSFNPSGATRGEVRVAFQTSGAAD